VPRRFVVWAVLLEAISMFALALMERRILILAGLRLPVGRAIAIAYASNAMAKSLPIIGSGAPTGFSYRRLVFQGAAPTVAGWALILAGIVSNAAFVVVISIGAIVSAGLAEGPDPRQAGPRRHCGDRETRGGYRRCRRRRCR
jgi:putative heme transporter